MRKLLAREHHLQQALQRPNVVQTLLKGLARTSPTPRLPAQMVKYLGKTFNAWHIAISMLQRCASRWRGWSVHVSALPMLTWCGVSSILLALSNCVGSYAGRGPTVAASEDGDGIEEDDRAVVDASVASLGELFSHLAEEDMYCGLWRRRCTFPETNAALSYEQNGYVFVNAHAAMAVVLCLCSCSRTGGRWQRTVVV